MFLAQQNPGMTIVIILLVVFLLVPLFVFLAFARVFNLWFQAYMSGVGVPMVEILGMIFRKVDAKAVVKALIMAKQVAGVDLSREELERAYLQGADLDKLARAVIRAKEQNIEITFQELVEADRNDRLAEMINMK